MLAGEVFRARLTPSHAEILDWIDMLPGPCAVVYESGPTGFGLARAVAAAGCRCKVAASPKLQRPGEVTPVRVSPAAEEAARDLVRAREAAR